VFHASILGLGALFGGLGPPKPLRGDGTEQTVDKSKQAADPYYTGCFTFVETKRLGTNPGF